MLVLKPEKRTSTWVIFSLITAIGLFAAFVLPSILIPSNYDPYIELTIFVVSVLTVILLAYLYVRRNGLNHKAYAFNEGDLTLISSESAYSSTSATNWKEETVQKRIPYHFIKELRLYQTSAQAGKNVCNIDIEIFPGCSQMMGELFPKKTITLYEIPYEINLEKKIKEIINLHLEKNPNLKKAKEIMTSPHEAH